MKHSLPAQHRALMLLLVFFCLCGLPGLWMEAQARAEENGAGHSRVDIKDGRISVSAKDIPLKLLCKDIENKSGVRFRIQEARLVDNKLTIELKDLPLIKKIKRLLAHMNYMLTFDHRNKLSVVFIAGQAEHYTLPVLRKPPLRRDVTRIRRLPNRPRR